MNEFDFWIVRAIAARKSSLLAAGIDKKQVKKVLSGWATYGRNRYPRYRYEAVLEYVDAPMGRSALDAVIGRWSGKGVELLVNYHCSD